MICQQAEWQLIQLSLTSIFLQNYSIASVYTLEKCDKIKSLPKILPKFLLWSGEHLSLLYFDALLSLFFTSLY